MNKPARSTDASDLFAALLIELQEGGVPNLEALCGADPQTRHELRAAWIDWRRGIAALGGDRLSPAADAFLARELGGLDPAEQPDSPSDSAWSAVLAGLAKHSPGPGRYRLRGEIARGGMGAILKVWDDDLKRSLAKKVLISRGHPASAPDDRSLGRFLEEAQVTAQLEHPGIIPVHELGVDPEEGIYFTMRLVRGHDLRHVFTQVRSGAEGWSQPRALGVLLKVCEAMAYAHSRNIVHRDLKPANIMVGSFGEVYVMDWGLARVLSKDGESCELPTPHTPADLTEVTTLRSKLEQEEGTSPIFTQDGSIVGTPAFMPPEQACGELAAVGPHSDVYSVGAILYQLLSGRMPYAHELRALPACSTLERLLAGPPRPLLELAPEAPAELVAICEKAMQRDPAGRFADMQEFAEELRAFLEGRVVHSYRTGAIPEFVKWVKRNQATAATTAALLAALVGGAASVAWQQHRLAAQAQRTHEFREAPALIAELDSIAPLDSSAVPALEHWISSVEALVARTPVYRAEFEQQLAASEHEPSVPDEEQVELEFAEKLPLAFEAEFQNARAGSIDGEPMNTQRAAGALEILPRVIAHMQSRAEHIRSLTLPRASFDDPRVQREHDRVRSLLRDLTHLAGPTRGGLVVARERLASARTLASTLEDPRWEVALASISDAELCPAYDGLEFAPQVGLVPLRRDPRSGLWEFLHLLSGEAPTYGPDGVARVGPETGIVFVLLPGGTFIMGAQKEHVDQPNYDDLAADSEGFLQSVTLAPYLFSKYELTQAQWQRVSGKLRSTHQAGSHFPNSPRISLSHPVETVSYDEGRKRLALWGLDYPTEAQHEFASRSGTSLRYGSTDDFTEAQYTMNVLDYRARDARSLVDGYVFTAPVDAYPPNSYGLHSTLGNVREWCREWYATGGLDSLPFYPGTGELPQTNALFRTTRGGSYQVSDPVSFSRVSTRVGVTGSGAMDIGIRPVRALDPRPAPASGVK